MGDMPSLKVSLTRFLSVYDDEIFSFGELSLSFLEPENPLDATVLSLLDLDFPEDRICLSFLDPESLNASGSELPSVMESGLGESSLRVSFKLWLGLCSSIEDIDVMDVRISV
jgi:hypothetical protein